MATDETTSAKVQTAQDRPQTAAEQRAASHDGTTDTDQLVSDIEKTRGELAETLDAIVDRVDPKKVADRTKAQAREAAKEGVEDAKAAAASAAAVVKEKASAATEAVKEKAAEVKEKVSGSSPADSQPVRSPLTPATSVSVDAATPVTGAATGTAVAAGTSPLPSNAQSVDAGGLPPAEPADSPGSLADRADTTSPTVEPAGADLPAWSPARPAAYEPSQVPALVGAGAAAAAAVGAALVLLVLRRRRG